MPTNLDNFYFDVNFGLGNNSVFTLTDQEELAPFPPIEGYFLLLDGTNFLLLDNTNLTLL